MVAFACIYPPPFLPSSLTPSLPLSLPPSIPPSLPPPDIKLPKGVYTRTLTCTHTHTFVRSCTHLPYTRIHYTCTPYVNTHLSLQLTLYDTAGMERFDSTVPPTYFRHAKAVIFVYAIDNQESIGDVIHWAESITPQRLGAQSAELICVLVGNKVDEEKTREVSTKRAMDTAEKCGFDKDMVFEISAKTGHGVEEMFDAIANRLIALGQESQIPQLTPVPSKKGTGGCCS